MLYRIIDFIPIGNALSQILYPVNSVDLVIREYVICLLINNLFKV